MTEESQSEESKRIQQLVLENKDLDRSSFVVAPGTNLFVPKRMQKEYVGLDWKETHHAIGEDRLRMPIIAEFMPYVVNVIRAQQKKSVL